ncbi:hypothetical protein HYW76_04005 [Candidatus Pacearchaeota archaeon]|nr:hypothetical protein [Candidatus Pacearchaeota archaeon]
MYKEKKGLSAVVITILFVLLGIIAVVIIWAAIRSQINTGTSESTRLADCMRADVSVESAIENIDDATTADVVVRRGLTSSQIDSIKILIDGSDSGGDFATIPAEGGKTTNTIDATTVNKVSLQIILPGNVRCPASAEVQVTSPLGEDTTPAATVCNPTTDCKTDATKPTCKVVDSAITCVCSPLSGTVADSCPTGKVCQSDVCKINTAGTACDATNLCSSAYTCESSVCKANAGTACTAAGNECKTGLTCNAQNVCA